MIETCPECGQGDGLYRDDVRRMLQCDNCGWYEGKEISGAHRDPAPEALRIEQIMLYVAKDADGNEGIPAFLANDGVTMCPMVCADQARAESLRPIAEAMVRTGATASVELVRFTNREHVEEIR